MGELLPDDVRHAVGGVTRGDPRASERDLGKALEKDSFCIGTALEPQRPIFL